MTMDMAVSERFLAHVFAGEMSAALDLVHPDATFVATRPDRNPGNALHGTWRGPDGVGAFFDLFLSLVQPQEFHFHGRCCQGDHEVLFGSLRHVIRRTQQPFASDWAAITQLLDRQMLRWHFYEDSEALRDAL